jgi:2-phosphoglycerate kinase
MIFLLGGPPRVGKSIIAKAILQKHPMSIVSTDSLCVVLQNVLSPKSAPDLFIFDRFNKKSKEERLKLITNDPEELIDYVRKESRVVWKAIDPFIRRENEEGRDVMIEGVAILPELISQLEISTFQVVFVGNQGEKHEENIKKFADENEADWMRDESDQYICAFALFVKKMSATIEIEVNKYGFKYIEMDNKLLGNVTEEVMKSLGLSVS